MKLPEAHGRIEPKWPNTTTCAAYTFVGVRPGSQSNAEPRATIYWLPTNNADCAQTLNKPLVSSTITSYAYAKQ